MDNDTPPPALQQAVAALAQRLGRRLDLVPAARSHWWSVLTSTTEGKARVFLAAQEEGPLYATLTRRLRDTAAT